MRRQSPILGENPPKKCPKCGFINPTTHPECVRCGVIFARIHPQGKEPPRGPKGLHTAKMRSTGTKASIGKKGGIEGAFSTCLRTGLLVGLTLWGYQLAAIPLADGGAGNSPLHLVNLPFHEAGHLIFSPLGRVIHSLGGTLGQLLMPLTCLLTLLWKEKDTYGAAVCLWWLGENLLDIAPYIDDARRLSLPLLGGNVGQFSPYGFHDWEFILTETGLLAHDHAIAGGVKAMGIVLMMVAIAWGTHALLRGRQEKR